MIQDAHKRIVKDLAKKGNDILKEMNDTQAELAHMAMLITGEAGELCDAIKKHVIYQKPLDIANVVEELGDIEWTLERIRQLLSIDRTHTLMSNIEKLKKRYPNLSYSNNHAQERADKE